ncbi:MAG: prepilin-type N-terminal cleavage/methylation domain-containing protein [Burkholderiales bacterium]|jgi:general secretion pathway protein G|nr:prepilin-type N-terminal cleavage/methylation domain-containing protein [Burkholderiales bacterium]
MIQQRKSGRGFTLIELLVVMAIIALLLTLAAPRYFQSVQRSREAVLKEDLHLMRDAIDKHYADTGKYPANLDELVTKKYLRRIPVDPITESATTWVIVDPPDKPDTRVVYDVRSGAPGKSIGGTPYGEF